jgi:hypothetical protein
MDGRQEMRASDRDRQEVVDRLRGALEDGRLQMDEFVDRMGRAYQAVTYGDLAPLSADLPASGSRQEATLPAPVAPVGHPWRGALAGLPTTLKVMWTIWLAAVSINVVVWALVSATTVHLLYPWPLWVAGPWGAALLAKSVGATVFRRSRLTAAAPGRPVRA